MPLEIKLTPKLTYKLRLSPQMKLSLNLLQHPLLKLKEYVTEQIETNPLLEPIDSEPISTDKQVSDILTDIEQEKTESELPWLQEDEEKRRYRESLITVPLTLQEHLSKQLYLHTSSDEERKIGESIIGNINDNGYLGCPIEDVAKSTKTTVSRVEKVLFLIQSLDPVGIAARNLRECLLLQLKAKGEENTMAGRIVDKYLPFVEKKRYGHIAKKLKVSVEIIKDVLQAIANLEPKPGRSFSTEKTICLVPDIIVRKNEKDYEIMLNEWELPRINLNAKYINMLKQKNTPEDAKEYLGERLKAARSLINALNKRYETVKKVAEEIVHLQKEFFDSGETNFKPMTLSQLANKVGKHKSTMSRAIANKYLQTPQGIFALGYFLNSGVKQENGGLFSSKTIKSKIKNLVENENKENPLSDQKITARLKQQGIDISRRTVTKYRKKLKILPSASRRG